MMLLSWGEWRPYMEEPFNRTDRRCIVVDLVICNVLTLEIG